MINSSVGGTDAELWASTESLVKLGQPYVRQVEQGKLIARSLEEALAAYKVDLEDWAKKLPLYPSKEMLAQYTADDMDDSKWTPVELPTPFHEAFDGSVWYRRDFELKDQPDPKSQVKLSLGRIDDYDLAYINGQKVGGIGHENGSAWATPRNYEFPASVLRQGKNTMVVRVFDVWYGGGFVGIANQMHLTVGDEKVSLAGTWKSLVEVELDLDQRGIAAARPEDPRHAMGVPARLYNGMIHPLQPYAIAGAIWYQGENNAGRFVEYRRLLPAMIESWREAWNQQTQPLIRGEAGRDFPFYIVQLANYMGTTTDPGQISVWAGLRDAQWETAKNVKNSGLAVAIDIGEANDIHPRNKLDVGKRLAAIALNQTYGHNVPYAGPTPTKLTVSQGKVVIQYDHANGGLMAKPLPAKDQDQQADSLPPVKGFAIEDEAGKWHWATARIASDNTVEVWNDEVKSPRTVRYGWADNPVVNLYNQAGFPAVPFELKP
ncbi:MAG: hypothetical protein HC898_12830 [Phycisphaerales bacterium]|nr:hypothetical protein [Phycisphaerales bacterium]